MPCALLRYFADAYALRQDDAADGHGRHAA